MIALVETVAGTYAVDLDDVDVSPAATFVPEPQPDINLPRVVCVAACGSTIAALVDAKPPLLLSYDAGTTWQEGGRGLPPGRAVAIAASDPDLLVYAARNRLYISRNAGVFWTALEVELPEIVALAITE
ncbi:MAG: hypothetical protein F2663_01455 [Actinobacteria bacterium]|uniref:Unannotated protein n=1 Tax=freshwater metagenome TaxID=449393 RepID=A0A6J6NII2_9ZZZZ|nr:hypothetical protein [Actinomycetota bacterium]